MDIQEIFDKEYGEFIESETPVGLDELGVDFEYEMTDSGTHSYSDLDDVYYAYGWAGIYIPIETTPFLIQTLRFIIFRRL